MKKFIAIGALAVIGIGTGYAASATPSSHRTGVPTPSIIKYEFIYNKSGQLIEFVTQDSAKNLFYYPCSNVTSLNGNVEYSCDHQ